MKRAKVAAAVSAVVVAAACNGVPGTPAPRPKHTEDAPSSDYQCGYDGNGRCAPKTAGKD